MLGGAIFVVPVSVSGVLVGQVVVSGVHVGEWCGGASRRGSSWL